MENTSDQGHPAIGLARRLKNRVQRLNKVQRLAFGLVLLATLAVSFLLLENHVKRALAELQPRPAKTAQIPPKPETAPKPPIPEAPQTPLPAAPASAVADASLMAGKESKAGSEGAASIPVQPENTPKTKVSKKHHHPPRRANSTAAQPAKPAPGVNFICPRFNDIMTAVILKDADTVTQLLDLGWWVDRPDYVGYTPLMEAVSMGNRGMAELLLKRHANPNARSPSALQIARHNQDPAMETLLLRYGAQ
jgi:Ankyrin repeat